MPQDKRIVLAGDIGGTKTNLGLYVVADRNPVLLRSEKFASNSVHSLSQMLTAFLHGEEKIIDAACFGVAGPVIKGHCRITNLTWEISEDEIRQNFSIPKVKLINDLSAIGFGIQLLDETHIDVLNEGEYDPNGVVGIIAPGTGLGMSIITPIAGRLEPWPSEGGHIDFAPTNERELELWRYLSNDFQKHISLDTLVSGRGIHLIFQWLESAGKYEIPTRITEAMKTRNPTAVISEAALDGSVPICVDALDMFISLFGSAAGNLALIAFTSGGLYLGGGVPPKILPRLKTGPFMRAFTNKGRFSEFMKRIPVKVILEDRLGLMGAAICGAECLETRQSCAQQ